MNKENMSYEEGLLEIMNIIGDCEMKKEEPVTPKKKETLVIPEHAQKKESSITYDGRGAIIAVNGKKTTTGATKKRKVAKNTSDVRRADLLDEVEVALHNSSAFTGKLGKNSQEGIIIRLEDADYAVKIQGHTKNEFDLTDKSFVAIKDFSTRGKVNHSSAIAKYLTSEIENGNLGTFFNVKGEQTNEIHICAAKSSGIRVQMKELSDGRISEITIKITKKTNRVVCS